MSNPTNPYYAWTDSWHAWKEGYRAADQAIPVEPTEHQHQWLPWLTLPNGSSWTQCVPCGEQFQYDHG